MHDKSNRLRACQQTQIAQNVDEVMRTGFSGAAGEQNMLGLLSIVNVGRDVDHRHRLPPQHGCRSKRVTVLRQKNSAEHKGQPDLKQGAAEQMHELTER